MKRRGRSIYAYAIQGETQEKNNSLRRKAMQMDRQIQETV